MNFDSGFWLEMEKLLRSASIVTDRPQGEPHPRYPEMIYPLDYGYLENTSAGDGDDIDVWIGSKAEKTLTGILCTFDKMKKDAEIKLLIGCTPEDVATIQRFHSHMATLFIPNPKAENDLPNRVP